MRRVAVFIGLVCLATAVSAAVTEIKVEPDPPIVVGTTVTYTVVSDKQALDYRLRYRCMSGATGTWVTAPGGGPGYSLIESRVGNFDVEGGAAEVTGPDGQTTWAYLTRQVSVLGPDSDEITDGLNVDSSGWHPMVLEVKFKCLAGAKTMGGANIEGYPQERIRRPQRGEDTGWIGPKSGIFYWDDMSRIIDVKTVMTVPEDYFKTWPDGFVFDDFFQQNRFVIKNCFGNDQYFYFQERHFQKVKN